MSSGETEQAVTHGSTWVPATLRMPDGAPAPKGFYDVRFDAG